jgi:transposase, IS5 family
VERELSSSYDVAPANTHESQLLLMPLHPENTDHYVWADSAYVGECFEGVLNLGGFESCIHERPAAITIGQANERNRVKSAIRACLEHVFG